MSQDLIKLKAEVMLRSNHGLDIIMEIYPEATTHRNFRIRSKSDDKNASASLTKQSDDTCGYVWTLKDHAVGNAKNAVTLYQEEHGLKFYEAVLALCQRYGIETGQKKVVRKATFKTIPRKDYEKDLSRGFDISYSNDMTDEDMASLGPFVTSKGLQQCNCFKVNSYSFLKKDKATGHVTDTVIEISSNENFPIFCLVNQNKDTGEDFYKIIQPKAAEKKDRFRYFGKKPKDFINGLAHLKREFEKIKQAYVDAVNDEDKKAKKNMPDKVDYVLICSGERDSFNAASFGYPVLWHNSETAEWDHKTLNSLFTMAYNVVNIPDIDETGIREGKALAFKDLRIKTLWLPSYLRQKRNWRGNRRKDLLDWFEINTFKGRDVVGKMFRKQIEKNSYQLQFWDVRYSDKGVKFDLNNVILDYFLEQSGIYRFDDKASKEGFSYIKINGHTVEKILPNKIIDYIEDFLKKRYESVELRNFIRNTPKISEKKIVPKFRELNFRQATPDSQVLSFSHENWTITKDSIVNNAPSKAHVWVDNVLDKKQAIANGVEIDTKKIKIDSDYFKISKESGEWDIEVLEKDCDFLNFIINTSRVHWVEEFITPWLDNQGDEWGDAYNKKENIEYRKQNKFNIAGAKLTPEQVAEQKQHLINKIFAIGYTLHAYKNPTKPWAIYVMENALVDDNESRGGTGKSLFSGSLESILMTMSIAARKNDLFTNNHLYHGVTEHTQLIHFDDAYKGFKLGNIYTEITGIMNVNPKFGDPFTIPFKYSPKIVLTSNFALTETDQSTLRRLLYVAFSDFYHVGSDDRPGHTPHDDFNRQLFLEWDSEQYNKFFNFFAQCIKAYLKISSMQNSQFNPPMVGIKQRNLKAKIGPVFLDWADEFFADQDSFPNPNDKYFSIEFDKKKAIENLQSSKRALANITSNSFVKRLKAYCQYKDHLYMPGQNGRYQKVVVNEKGKKVKVDYILIGLNADESDINLNEVQPPKLTPNMNNFLNELDNE